MIKKLTLKNFRNFSDYNEELGERNKITGRNGSGKTTIKEAILYCLYGIDNTGTNRLNESLIKNGELLLEVEIELDNGSHLKRIKNSEKSKVMFAENNHDKYEFTAQRDLDSIFPDKVLFQSIFDVGYFFTMTEKEQREVILQATPTIDRRDLFKQSYDKAIGLYDKWECKLDKGYTIERNRLMRLRSDLEQEMAVIRGNCEADVYKKEDIEYVEKIVNNLQKEIEKIKNICEKCKQPILSGNDKSKMNEYLEKKAELEMMIRVYEKQSAKITDRRTQLSHLSDKMMELTELIDIFAPNQMPAVEFDIKLKPIVKFANTICPDITVETIRLQKNMVWEEVFIVKLRGVPYQRLSTGEQKRVSLAFSEMLDKLTGYKVGIKFMDHMECITGKLPQVGGQLILAGVTDEEYKLRKEL